MRNSGRSRRQASRSSGGAERFAPAPADSAGRTEDQGERLRRRAKLLRDLAAAKGMRAGLGRRTARVVDLQQASRALRYHPS